jgi:hypothetical protein
MNFLSSIRFVSRPLPSPNENIRMKLFRPNWFIQFQRSIAGTAKRTAIGAGNLPGGATGGLHIPVFNRRAGQADGGSDP